MENWNINYAFQRRIKCSLTHWFSCSMQIIINGWFAGAFKRWNA